ncbi:Regulator of chromosome condensation (RCC1) repeat protein [compost metagenome]
MWTWRGDEKPKKVQGLSNINTISGGMEYTIAVDADANLWSWGDNTYGQLGDGTTINRDTPVKISLEGGTPIEIGYGDDTVYTVKEEGKQLSFSAEFPSSWKDKYLVKQQDDWVGIYHNTNLEETAMILSFHAISLKDWEEYVELDPGYPWWNKLGEVNGMVIVSSQITDQPYSNGTSEETKEVMRMLEHIDEIRISNIKDH